MVQVAGVKGSGQVALIGVQGRQKCQPHSSHTPLPCLAASYFMKSLPWQHDSAPNPFCIKDTMVCHTGSIPTHPPS